MKPPINGNRFWGLHLLQNFILSVNQILSMKNPNEGITDIVFHFYVPLHNGTSLKLLVHQ